MVRILRSGVTLLELMVVAAMLVVVLVMLSLALHQSVGARRHADRTLDQQGALRVGRARLTKLPNQGLVTSPAAVSEVSHQLSYLPFTYDEEGRLQVDAQGQPETGALVTISVQEGQLVAVGAQRETVARLGEGAQFTVERLPSGLLAISLTAGPHQLEFEIAVRSQ